MTYSIIVISLLIVIIIGAFVLDNINFGNFIANKFVNEEITLLIKKYGLYHGGELIINETSKKFKIKSHEPLKIFSWPYNIITFEVYSDMERIGRSVANCMLRRC